MSVNTDKADRSVKSVDERANPHYHHVDDIGVGCCVSSDHRLISGRRNVVPTNSVGGGRSTGDAHIVNRSAEECKRVLSYDVRYLSSPIHESAGLLGSVLLSCCRICAGAYGSRKGSTTDSNNLRFCRV